MTDTSYARSAAIIERANINIGLCDPSFQKVGKLTMSENKDIIDITIPWSKAVKQAQTSAEVKTITEEAMDEFYLDVRRALKSESAFRHSCEVPIELTVMDFREGNGKSWVTIKNHEGDPDLYVVEIGIGSSGERWKRHSLTGRDVFALTNRIAYHLRGRRKGKHNLTPGEVIKALDAANKKI